MLNCYSANFFGGKELFNRGQHFPGKFDRLFDQERYKHGWHKE
jgi:hypothetical protein